jgi:hypothetical protein
MPQATTVNDLLKPGKVSIPTSERSSFIHCGHQQRRQNRRSTGTKDWRRYMNVVDILVIEVHNRLMNEAG